MKNAMLGVARYRTPMLAVMVTLGTLMPAQPSHAAAGVRMASIGPDASAPMGLWESTSVYLLPLRIPAYHSPVSCAHGPYRAGCVRPHGGAVVRRPY